MTGPAPSLPLAPAALDRLLPLHARVDAGGGLCGLGPTLARLVGPQALGQPLGVAFALVHPANVVSVTDLLGATSLRLVLRGPFATPLKGVAVPMIDGGALLNLSFSYRLQDAVRDHRLSASDFAPTDLANEYLYLVEANAAILTEARRASDRLRGARALALEQALTDPLTGLRNRRGLDRALSALVASGQPFGLIHIDLDHFKHINDSLGHAAGDQALAEVAARLKHAVRDADGVARLGGDEFVVLLPGLRDRAAAAQVAERILRDLQRPLALPPPAPPLSASLGVALCDGMAPVQCEALLLAADRALYRSKGTGRSRISFATAPDAA